MSNKLRFMYGGMRHLVQHSRQLPKELLKQSRGIGVQWDSWWSREMFGLDVAMLSPKRMLPLLNVWQEEGWGEEGVTHFVWQIMALKFWINAVGDSLSTMEVFVSHSYDPRPISRKLLAKRLRLKLRDDQGCDGIRGRDLSQHFLTEDKLSQKVSKSFCSRIPDLSKMRLFFFSLQDPCFFPCRNQYMIEQRISPTGFPQPDTLACAHWRQPPKPDNSQPKFGGSDSWGGCLWCEVSVPFKKSQNQKMPGKKRWILTEKFPIVANQLSNFFGEKNNKNPHVLTFWGHQLLAQMLLWGAFEVNDMLMLDTAYLKFYNTILIKLY